MAATINFHGALFDENADISPAIARAAHIAKVYGLGLVKARTPVDSGELKMSWKADIEGNGIRYTNEIPYAGFVEHGTRKMASRNMLSDSLPDIETVFYNELAKNVGQQLAADVIESAPTPSYGNSVKSDYPGVGDKVAAPKAKIIPKKFTKKYLFANPNDIVGNKQKLAVNASRPRWQKNKREFVPEFKVK